MMINYKKSIEFVNEYCVKNVSKAFVFHSENKKIKKLICPGWREWSSVAWPSVVSLEISFLELFFQSKF